MHENDIDGHVRTAAFKVHTTLGPGLYENVYKLALAHELRKNGLLVQAEVGIPVVYDGLQLDIGYRLDLLISGKVILELKSVDALAPVHFKQLQNYLGLTGHKLGLLINFNVASLREHIHRVVNKL
ncbi:MAG: GxxExxY protein [Hymenobacter sp.]|nr:MAG: GxxExxY protein [Hymenobacter sp.]